MREITLAPRVVNHAFGPWIQPLRRLVPASFDHYRPEKHYMRGPGPKWREKHGAAISPANTDLVLMALPLCSP
jgi:hypothetical protein